MWKMYTCVIVVNAAYLSISNGYEPYLVLKHTNKVKAVSFSPDGKYVATGTLDGVLSLWDADNGQILWSIQAHARLLSCLAFDHESKHVITAGNDGIVRCWNVASHKQAYELLQCSAGIANIAISSDSKLLAIAPGWGQARIYNLVTKKEQTTLGLEKDSYFCLAFGPGNASIALGSTEGFVSVYSDLLTGKERFDYQNSRSPICAIKYLDLSSLISVEFKGSAKIVNMKTHRVVDIGSLSKAGVLNCAVSPDATVIAAATGKNGIALYDCQKSMVVGEIKAHTAKIWQLSFSPDGLLLASGSYDGLACVWRVNDLVKAMSKN